MSTAIKEWDAPFDWEITRLANARAAFPIFRAIWMDDGSSEDSTSSRQTFLSENLVRLIWDTMESFKNDASDAHESETAECKISSDDYTSITNWLHRLGYRSICLQPEVICELHRLIDAGWYWLGVNRLELKNDTVIPLWMAEQVHAPHIILSFAFPDNLPQPYYKITDLQMSGLPTWFNNHYYAMKSHYDEQNALLFFKEMSVLLRIFESIVRKPYSNVEYGYRVHVKVHYSLNNEVGRLYSYRYFYDYDSELFLHQMVWMIKKIALTTIIPDELKLKIQVIRSRLASHDA